MCRENTNSNSPVTDVTSDDIRCNVGGLASGNTTSVATVAAGSTVGFAADQAIFHPGPLQVYMSEATSGDVKTYDGSGEWFKIYELSAEINSTAISWEDEYLQNFTFPIPAATRTYELPATSSYANSLIAAGQYLLRIEQIALHSASTEGGAQFYISCAQLDVTSSGTGTPSPTIDLPGGYNASDPGLLINIYWPIVSFCDSTIGIILTSYSQLLTPPQVQRSGLVKQPDSVNAMMRGYCSFTV
jgi:hypothetical protein